MKRALRLILVLMGVLTTGVMVSGCANETEDVALKKAGNPQVSNIPWNRPQGWEQGGAAGAFIDPRYR